MIRLVFADLVAQARVWTGMFAVVIAAGFVAALAAGLIDTGAAHGGRVQEGLSSTSAAVIMFTTVTALIVLSGAANLTVALQQRSYALWQLVGIRPVQIGLIVLAQLAIVTVLGAGIGFLLALPTFPPLFDYVFRTWDGMQGISLHLGGTSAIWVLLCVLGVVLLGGLRGARRASRVPPVEVLREPEMTQPRIGWFRCIILAGVLIGLMSLVQSLRDDATLNAISGKAVFLTPLIAATFAAAGPLLYPVVLRGWTALVSRRVSASWYFARHSAQFRLARSSAAIGPLMVAIALTGGLYTTAQSIEVASGRGGGLAPEGVVILLGGPLLLSLIAAAATVYMSSQSREREMALLQAAGATPATILLTALWEALVYAMTAALLGGLATVIGGVIIADSLGLDAPVIALDSVLLVTAGGFGALLLATTVPTSAALRHSVPRTFTVE